MKLGARSVKEDKAMQKNNGLVIAIGTRVGVDIEHETAGSANIDARGNELEHGLGKGSQIKFVGQRRGLTC